MIDTRRVLVCGSRYWNDSFALYAFLDGLLARHQKESRSPMVIIEGDAPGADTYAGNWAEYHPWDAELVKYPADWDKYGKAAGPIRNKQMLEEGKPTLVVAFTDNLEESKGTKNMVTQAKKAGVPVYVIGRA
jgi:hypothetical protein